MEQKLYTYGNFPFGLGAFGTGPVIEEEEEGMLVKYNTGGQKIYTSLTSYGDVILTSAATITTGDVQVSLDDGAFQNIASLPVVNNTRITVSLSAPETSCKQLQIRFQDQTNPPEWNPKVINVETYGNTNAYVIDSFNNVVSASNFVATDISSLATSAQANTINQNILGTSAAVKLIPTNNNGIVVSASNFVATDISGLATSVQATTINQNVLGTSAAVKLIPTNNNGITVSASNFVATDISSLATITQVDTVNQNVLGTSAAVKLIPTDNNGITVSASNFVATDLTSVMNALYAISAVTSQFTFSGSNVNANVANSGVLNNISISDILGSDIDGMTLEDALTKMLAWTLGNTAYSSDVFTYFKQDNSTPAFAISATDTTRTRL